MRSQPVSSARLAVSFITALIVANVSGPQYIYPAFGASLTTRFGWSALENSLVSTAPFVGVSFSGPLCAFMIERLGKRKTLLISAFLCFSGSFLLAQAYAGRLSHNVLLCAFYLICTGIGGSASYLCALDSQAQNFKAHRGMSMGLTSASVGLCGLVFSQINDFFFINKENPNDNRIYGFLIFMAITMSSGMILGSFFLIVQDHQEPEVDDVKPKNIGNDIHRVVIQSETSPLLQTKSTSLSGLKFFLHPAGFALFFTMFIVLGFGYVYLAGIGQMLMSLSQDPTVGSQHLRNIHVSIFSIGNCVSRGVFGTLSDFLKRRFHIHRLWIFWSASLAFLLTTNFLVRSVASTDDLLFGTIMMAIVYGAVFGVAPASTAEFGTQVFVRNWGWLLYSPAFGSQIFNILFGILYDAQAKRQGAQYCKGAVCFQNTFLIGNVLGVMCLFVLGWAIANQRPKRLLSTS
ncbi:major facilitator superfamily domain-containing protein [Phycomyces nitens]|nr:major facilitator superfamily domain-containing protein [Phycomyces nitens]